MAAYGAKLAALNELNGDSHRYDASAMPIALAARDTRGLIKLVADKTTERLLSVHVRAPEGADSIQTAALAIKHTMTTRELGETIFPYLTTVEGLKLAAQSFAMDLAMLSCCGG